MALASNCSDTTRCSESGSSLDCPLQEARWIICPTDEVNYTMEMLALPDHPRISPEMLIRCSDSNECAPVLFEWYKYVARCCDLISAVPIHSPGLADVTAVEYAILTGLVNRCSKLMSAVSALTSVGFFRETIYILGRCIFESALYVSWCCDSDRRSRIRRFLADSMRSEFAFRDDIGEQISKRGTAPLPIESRMLHFIKDMLEATGYSEEELMSAKGIPKIRQLCDQMGLHPLIYTVCHRLGSNAVHGFWPDLLAHYVFPDGRGGFNIRRESQSPEAPQFASTAIFVLQMLVSFLRAMSHERSIVAAQICTLAGAECEIRRLLGNCGSTDLGGNEHASAYE